MNTILLDDVAFIIVATIVDVFANIDILMSLLFLALTYPFMLMLFFSFLKFLSLPLLFLFLLFFCCCCCRCCDDYNDDDDNDDDNDDDDNQIS